ncbi:hypothetical protein OROGR_022248 [Orobanche gracilis]
MLYPKARNLNELVGAEKVDEDEPSSKNRFPIDFSGLDGFTPADTNVITTATAISNPSFNRSVLPLPAVLMQNKCIDNWDDICTLFASDRATGDGVEQHEESATAMEMENEVGSGSDTVSMESNKRIKRDRLANAVIRFAESFSEFVSKAQGPPLPSSKKIYDVISLVPRISRMEILKGVKSFMNGTVDMFDMLKSLPDSDKLDWVLLHIND